MNPERDARVGHPFLAATPGSLAPGAVVAGRYRIEALLGSGGMGHVYRATQLALGREVALKVLTSGASAADADRLRFEREAAVIAYLRHPNIVTVYDAGTEPGVGAFFAMELLTGRSLAAELDERKRLPISEAVGVMCQIANAVAAAHAAGVVHRDLKPGNVMLDPTAVGATVKVLDFGLAKLAGTARETPASVDNLDLTMPGEIFGTALYMSPEQARGLEVDERTDVWSLGVMLYELVSGTPPFDRTTLPDAFAAILHDVPEPLDQVVSGVPEALARLVERSLCKEADGRLSSVAEFARSLEWIARGFDVEADVGTIEVDSHAVLVAAGRVAPYPTSLPEETDSLVGRGEELRVLTAELRGNGARLLTLTGPGGTGKTRLAQAIAHELRSDFSDGAVFVDLSAIRDPALVAPTIARALGVAESSAATDQQRTIDHLRERATLLVLDNFEQVLDAAPFVARLLDEAPGLRALVTSRAPLRVSAEREHAVLPLALSSSVALFVARAKAARKSFVLTDANAETIAEICRQLEGLPLAVELAAARIKLISPDAVLAKLGERFELLTSGVRDRPERQRTMRGAVAWSYDLLDEDARRVFERISVFAGGCRFEQAEVVCGGEGSGVGVLDALTSLVESSLLATTEDADGEMRFRMLEVTREYAAERLQARGAPEAAARRHAEAFLAFAETTYPANRDDRTDDWPDRLESDHDNLRVALEWFLDHDAEACLRLSAVLANLWAVHGHYAEGRRWLTAALDRAADAPGLLRTRLILKAAALAEYQGDYGAAAACYERSLTEAGAIQNDVLAAWSRYGLGNVAYEHDRLQEAHAQFEDCLDAGRRLSDNLLTAFALSRLGDLARRWGEPARARPLFEQALAIFERAGDRHHIGTEIYNLGAVACEERRFDDAHARFVEALAVVREVTDELGAAHVLDGLAAVAAARRAWARAARLAGAAEALRRRVGGATGIVDRALREGYQTETRAAIGDEAFEVAATEGRALTLDEAHALALGDAR